MSPGGFPVVMGIGQCAFDALGSLKSYPPVDQKSELEGFLTQGGGPVATALVTLARLGVPTAFQGRVGDDPFGREILQGLEREGVDCSGLKVDPGKRSQFAFVAVEKSSGRRNIFWTRGSARPLRPEEVDVETLGRCRVLHLDGFHPQAARFAAGEARRTGAVTVLDGGTLREGVRDLLPLIDHLVVSEKFACQVGAGDPGKGMDLLLDGEAVAVTVTRGSRGSRTRSRAGEDFEQPAFSVAALDTTGCGDVFHGAYIFGLLKGWPLRRTVRFAAAAAALKARLPGGRTGIPSRSAIEEFLAAGS